MICTFEVGSEFLSVIVVIRVAILPSVRKRVSSLRVHTVEVTSIRLSSHFFDSQTSYKEFMKNIASQLYRQQLDYYSC